MPFSTIINMQVLLCLVHSFGYFQVLSSSVSVGMVFI